MDAVLHAQFQRVETALGTLVDSIAAYNPSPQAAGDLVAADDELSRRLDQLAQHQANHARIQSLRVEAEALGEQLKSSVAALATLRRELFDTPATTFPHESRPVPFDELLQYAKNIAKYTVPPTYRERIPTGHQDKGNEDGGSSGAASNGVNTPANGGALTQELPGADEGNEGEGEGEGDASKNITAEEAEWLRKLKESNMPWFPWPDDGKIRRSNLMQIQYLRDTGQDPTQVDLTKLAEDEKERIAAEAQRVAAQASGSEAVEAPVQTVPKVESAPRPPEKERETFKGFGFTDDVDDE